MTPPRWLDDPVTLQVFKLDQAAKLPTKNNETDAGWDLYALHDQFIEVGNTVKVKTGLALNVPDGHVLKIEDRSGLASNGLRTGAGVVDSGYQGDVTIVLHNLNNSSDLEVPAHPMDPTVRRGYKVKKGDKIAQALVIKVEQYPLQEVTTLWSSNRGSNGFGSSGR